MLSGRLTRVRHLSATLAVLIALVLVVATVAVTAALVRPPRPEALAAPEPVTQVATSEQAFADERGVDLTLELGEPVVLVSQAAGTVTASTCLPGSEAQSGVSSTEIDGVALVNLATSRPLWRDLIAGDSGEDVRALQDELLRLGHEISPTGTVDDATRSAAAALGLTDGSAFVARARTVWLPAPVTSVDACILGVGQSVDVGTTLATAPAPLRGLFLSTIPPATMPDDRVLVIDDVSFDLGSDARLTDPESLEIISGLPSVVAHRASDQTALLTGQYLLADPLTVIAVPARALFGASSEQAACLSVDGAAVPVIVIGSELGRSLVRLPEMPPPPHVDVMPAAGLTCG